MELQIIVKLITIYLIIGCIWNMIFTCQLKIIKNKDGEPIHPILVTLFSLYWIIIVPILIYSTMKNRKEDNDDL